MYVPLILLHGSICNALCRILVYHFIALVLCNVLLSIFCPAFLKGFYVIVNLESIPPAPMNTTISLMFTHFLTDSSRHNRVFFFIWVDGYRHANINMYMWRSGQVIPSGSTFWDSSYGWSRHMYDGHCLVVNSKMK